MGRNALLIIALLMILWPAQGYAAIASPMTATELSEACQIALDIGTNPEQSEAKLKTLTEIQRAKAYGCLTFAQAIRDWGMINDVQVQKYKNKDMAGGLFCIPENTQIGEVVQVLALIKQPDGKIDLPPVWAVRLVMTIAFPCAISE